MALTLDHVNVLQRFQQLIESEPGVKYLTIGMFNEVPRDGYTIMALVVGTDKSVIISKCSSSSMRCSIYPQYGTRNHQRPAWWALHSMPSSPGRWEVTRANTHSY